MVNNLDPIPELTLWEFYDELIAWLKSVDIEGVYDLPDLTSGSAHPSSDSGSDELIQNYDLMDE